MSRSADSAWRAAHGIVLIRHAAATGQEPEAPLTAEGFAQADALATRLVPLGIERVISSPYRRAVQSIEPFCSRTNLVLETDERLVERVLCSGQLPGWREQLRRSFDELDLVFEGGESSRVAQARGVAVLDSALASGRRTALVTHGNLLALLLKHVDATAGYDTWAALTNPDVFVLTTGQGGRARFERAWVP